MHGAILTSVDLSLVMFSKTCTNVLHRSRVDAGEPCETYTNPYSCQKDPFCIWCLDPTMCMEGAFGKPAFMECERLATDNLEDIRGAFPMSIAPERTPTVDREGYESTRMPDDIDAR